MLIQDNRHDDTKLLLAIASVIVAGAAGIAFIAGWVHEPTEESPTPGRAVASRPIVPAAEPAIVRAAAAPVEPLLPATRESVGEKIGGSTVPEELVEEVESACLVGPSGDLLGTALEAYRSRDFALSALCFGSLGEARPDDAWVHYMLGLSLWKAGSAEPAAEAMRRSTELQPASIRGWINLSRIENDRGRFDAALEAAETALHLDEGDAAAHFMRGRSLYNLSRTAEAVVALERSVTLDDANGYAHNLLGLILLERGEAGQAVVALERAAELRPEVAYIQNNLGMALELDGRRDAAIEAYRRAVAADPAHDKATRNLARLDEAAPPAVETATNEEQIARAIPAVTLESPSADDAQAGDLE